MQNKSITSIPRPKVVNQSQQLSNQLPSERRNKYSIDLHSSLLLTCRPPNIRVLSASLLASPEVQFEELIVQKPGHIFFLISYMERISDESFPSSEPQIVFRTLI